MTENQIEQLIDKAYTEMGVEPIEGEYFRKIPDPENDFIIQACPIGAACYALGKLDDYTNMRSSADILKQSEMWVNGVTNGFDYNFDVIEISEEYERGVRFGRKMRDKYIKDVSIS